MPVSRWNVVLLLLFVFIVALIPRVLPRDIYTIDETFHWVGRSERFLAALEAGDLRNTAQAFHPGVMTTWLGAVGILLNRIVNGNAPVDYFTYVNTMRIPAALVNTLTIVVAYWLLRQLLGVRVALLGALLWATEPFIVAHSAILHVDALSMSFMTLSLLAGWYALRLESISFHSRQPVRWHWLIFSAVIGGFAILTKFTTLFVFPMIALYSRFSMWRSLRPPKPVLAMMLWLVIAGVVWFGLYPATWANMDYVLSWLNHGADLALSPHNAGNFFMGQPVENPGILFYFVTILLRLTPWALIGLFVSMLGMFRQDFRSYRRIVFPLLFTALMYVIIMTAQPKKFDRYILQIFPLLIILSACGWVWLAERMGSWLQKNRPAASKVFRPLAVWGVITAIVIVNLWSYHPYYLSYYSPLLGGGSTAQQTMLVGWGEGLEQVAAYIRAQRDSDAGGCDYQVMGYLPEIGVLSPVLPCVVAEDLATDTLPRQGYVVLYVSMMQRQRYDELRAAIGDVEPIHVVSIHGIDYAHIYDALALNTKF